MAFKTFLAGAALTAAEMNDYVMEQVVIGCTAATRPGSPQEAMTVAETDTDIVQMWDGAAWVPVLNYGPLETFTPTWTNLTVGNGTVTAKYTQSGKWVQGHITIVFGTTTAITGSVSVSLPATHADAALRIAGKPVLMFDTSATDRRIGGSELSGSSVAPFAFNGTAGQTSNVNATIPFTWATGDTLSIPFEFEAA